MVNPKAQKIIDELMKDKALYKEMSEKEGNVWGKVFSDERRNEALKEDREAAFDLKLNRNATGLPPSLDKNNLTPTTGLSLACGGGRAERDLMSRGICSNFNGVDISEAALEEARAEAAKGNYDITYEQADLNELVLEIGKYDLVVAQNCLHHVLQLEHLADQIRDSIADGGVLWISDYIGETQFQYDEERMDLVNKILDILPESYLENKVNQKNLSELVRRDPGTLISPFEAIRSAEIVPVFLERFEVIERYEANAFINLVCPVGTRHHYLQNEEGRTIFELLLLFDKLLIDNNVLTPRMGSYLLKPKHK